MSLPSPRPTRPETWPAPPEALLRVLSLLPLSLYFEKIFKIHQYENPETPHGISMKIVPYAVTLSLGHVRQCIAKSPLTLHSLKGEHVPTRALAHTRTEPPCVCGRLFSVRQARGHHPLRPTGHQALKRLRVRQESSHTFPPPRPVHLSIPQSKPPPALTR